MENWCEFKNVVKEKNAAWYGIFNGLRDHSIGFALQLSSSCLQVFMSLNHMLLKSGGGSAVSWSQWRNIVKWYKMPFSLDVSWLKLLLQICMSLPLRSDQVMSQGIALSWLALDTVIYRCSCKIISFTVTSFPKKCLPSNTGTESRAGDYTGRWYAMHIHQQPQALTPSYCANAKHAGTLIVWKGSVFNEWVKTVSVFFIP